MKLISGKPFWSRDGDEWITAPELDRDIACDVVIVGAGVTGALIADALSRDGFDVVIVDKNHPGRGSTSGSTALLMYELDVPLHKLSRMIGSAAAARAYRLGVDAIGRIGQLAAELPADCDFRMKPSVYLTARRGNTSELQAEYEARKAIGLNVEWLSRADIAARFSFERHAGILSQDAAEIDPFKFTLALLRRSVSRGLQLFGRTTIASVTPTPTGILAKTQTGRRIRAGKLIHATGYSAAQYIGQKLAIGRVSYAVATTPLEHFDGWWKQCLLWEAADPYLYLRTLPNRRAMIGGLDDRGLRFINDQQRQRRKAAILTRRFSRMFPRIDFEIEAAWAGVFETTRDGLPFIGNHPRFPNSLFALGYGGNGITFAAMAVDIIQDLLHGRENNNLRLFAFDRPSLQPGAPLGS